MMLGALGCSALALAAPAGASAFRAGLVAPTPVPAAATQALGASLQRYDLVWRGEASYTGTVAYAPSTTAVLALYPLSRSGYGAAMAPRFCAWVRSVLDRWPAPWVVLGNEPGLGYEAAYAETLRACAPTVHALGSKVAGPGLHPMPLQYAQVMARAIARGAPGALDAFDYHPYWYSSYSYDQGMVALVHHELGLLPVWVTEDGEQTLYPGWDQWYSYTEAEQARRVAQSMTAARCAGVSAWFNFLYQDEGTSQGWQSGLLRVDGSAKPAWAAYAAAARATSCPPVASYDPPRPRPAWPASVPHEGQTGRAH